MKQVHLTLQGKGGIGKSLVASLIAQYLRNKGEPVVVIDADPVSATLSEYKALNATRLDLLEGGRLIEGKFDAMMLRIFEEDSSFVIDNGPSTFITLSAYLLENDAVNMIADRGKQVVIHTVITGGQTLLNTASDLYNLIRAFGANASFVVWLNPYWGEIEKDGKSFTDFKVYKENKDRIAGYVSLPGYQPQTYGSNVSDMLENFMTFDEADQSSDFGVVAKRRLLNVKKMIYSQMETVI